MKVLFVGGSKEWEDIVYGGIYAPIRALKNHGLEAMEDVRSTMSGNEFQNWEEEQIRVAQRDGDVTNGLMVAGQVSAAIHDVPTVGDLISRIVSQARGLLREAQLALREPACP